MTNKELLEEIRINREEIKKLHQDFYLFKGKAFGFISILSAVINIAMHFMSKK